VVVREKNRGGLGVGSLQGKKWAHYKEKIRHCYSNSFGD